MDRYICIHGHFYQPPRENPWLEEIELQDSAHPFHDWNERISTECYAPNAHARLLDGEGRILRLSNNYSRISFNFGPTLLSWLEAKDPDVYRAIVEADADSRRRFGGHGSAMAQVYNHAIMPLCNERDRRTQVAWGVVDFVHRFGRRPEGMWLAETAADIPTLEVLAEFGVQFTVLSPYQAKAVRPIAPPAAKSPPEWCDVSGGRVDPKSPYLVRLPSGRSIAVFFYDGPVSQAVAFERLLSKGEHLAARLQGAFLPDREGPQLVHIATDGESYGHHSAHGDMALAYALHAIERDGKAKLTNYGEYLERFPPLEEATIHEPSAWSCPHGVGRWERDCGCNSGGKPGWHQRWRGPLRAALDWLRETVTPLYEQAAGEILADPWKARDDAVHLRLVPTPESRHAFLARHARAHWTPAEAARVLRLMELQRNLLLMYTSCGWFFDDISGLETVQILTYAGRAIQLAEGLFGKPLEAEFLVRLEPAEGNVPEYPDGKAVYRSFVQPARLTWEKIAAHYAISSLFESYGTRTRLFGYSAHRLDYHAHEVGEVRLVFGRVRLEEELTGESETLAFGVLYFGDHNLNCGVRADPGESAYRALTAGFLEAWSRLDYPQIIRLMDRDLGESSYSLASLFRDEQRQVLRKLLRTNLAETEATYARVFQRHQPLMRFLKHLNSPLPRAFALAAEFLYNADMRAALDADEPDFAELKALATDAAGWGLPLDAADLAYRGGRMIARVAERWAAAPTDAARLRTLMRAVEFAQGLPFEVDLWKAQNLVMACAERSRPASPEFRALCERLRIQITG